MPDPSGWQKSMDTTLARIATAPDLVERLDHTLARMEVTLEQMETSVDALKAATNALCGAVNRRVKTQRVRLFGVAWLRAYVAASDLLARHVTGELRDDLSKRRCFRYQASRLVRGDYYSVSKLYSGEAEDDANEALRQLRGLRPVERLEARFDWLGSRREAVQQALRNCEQATTAALRASFTRDFPSETLRGPDFTLSRSDLAHAENGGGRLRKKRKRDSDSSCEDVAAVKRRAGLSPERLSRAAEVFEGEEGARPNFDAQPREQPKVQREDEDELVAEAAEAAGDWHMLEVVARRRLRHAIEEELPIEQAVARRRCLARALSRLGRRSEAFAELGVAMLSAKAARCSEELERCNVDRGLIWLEVARSVRNERDEKVRFAALAIAEFEASRGMCEKYAGRQPQSTWRHAWARARYNCGLAHFETGDINTAGREFEAAALAFDETRRTGDVLATELRATALCYAADCTIEPRAALGAYRAALVAVPDDKELTHLKVDALNGIERTCRVLGDAEAADIAAAQCSELNCGDEDEDAGNDADEPRFVVEGDTKSPLCVGGRRNQPVPGEALRSRFEYLPAPAFVYDSDNDLHRHRPQQERSRPNSNPKNRRVACATSRCQRVQSALGGATRIGNDGIIREKEFGFRNMPNAKRESARQSANLSSRTFFVQSVPVRNSLERWCQTEDAWRLFDNEAANVTAFARVLDDHAGATTLRHELEKPGTNGISVTDCRLGPGACTVLASMAAKIRSLRLSRCGLDAACLDDTIVGVTFPLLERLDLAGNPLGRCGTGEGLRSILEFTSRLKELDISACLTWAQPAAAAVAAAFCAGLASRKIAVKLVLLAYTTLPLASWARLCALLAHCPPATIDARSAAAPKGDRTEDPATGLGALVVGSARLAHADPRLLLTGTVAPDRHRDVQAIDIRGAIATSTRAATLIKRCSPNLRILDLSQSGPSALNAFNLSFPHLRTLVLRSSNLTASHLVQLLAVVSKFAPSLVTLDLVANDMAQDMNNHIRHVDIAIRRDRSLHCIDLSKNHISAPQHRAVLAAAWQARLACGGEQLDFKVQHDDSNLFILTHAPVL